jgi:hypothetical protein
MAYKWQAILRRSISPDKSRADAAANFTGVLLSCRLWQSSLYDAPF